MTQDYFCLFFASFVYFLVIVDHNVNKSTCIINNNKQSKHNQQKINKNNLYSCDICLAVKWKGSMVIISDKGADCWIFFLF